MRRPKAWRQRSLEELESKLKTKETELVLGLAIGTIKTPSHEEVQQRRALRRILLKSFNSRSKNYFALHSFESVVLRQRIRRLQRKVRRIKEGKFHKNGRE